MRANILFELNRYPEAASFAEQAENTFRTFGDSDHETQVGILSGAILFEQGNTAGAEQRWTSLLEPIRAAGDETSRARVLANLGCCRLLLGDIAGAEAYSETAARLYSELGMEIEILRVRWNLGRASLRKGLSARGIEELENVARAFRERGAVTDAAAAELDVVEELIRRRQFRRAATIARRLADVFTRAGQHVRTAEAMAYLYESVVSEDATPELVQSVRNVMRHPERECAVPDGPVN